MRSAASTVENVYVCGDGGVCCVDGRSPRRCENVIAGVMGLVGAGVGRIVVGVGREVRLRRFSGLEGMTGD